MNDRLAYARAKAIIEARLGRRLQPKEYVFHKDGDTENLSPENLELITPEDPRSVYFEDGEPRITLGAEVFG